MSRDRDFNHLEREIAAMADNLRAAHKAGKPFSSREFSGIPLDAIAHVWLLNRTRRHLSASQAAIADAKRNQMSDAYAPIKQAAKERQVEAGRQHGHGMQKVVEVIPQAIEPEGPKTRDLRAKAAGTNAKYIDVADKLVKERPELAEEVASGRKTITQVQLQIRKEELAARAPSAPAGKYRVIYADPPWKYNDALAISKTGLGESYGPAEAHYPATTITELCALPVEAIAEDNAVLFLWTTSPLLEDTFPIIKAWGFQYKLSFVWDKVLHRMGYAQSVFLSLRGMDTATKLIRSGAEVEVALAFSQGDSGSRILVWSDLN